MNVKSGPKGILEPETVAAVMDEDTAGIMITNPNTLGLYEEYIRKNRAMWPKRSRNWGSIMW